ncbi:MAG: DUF167 domain-containing protein [Candidatus Thorarchaeota archaeon]
MIEPHNKGTLLSVRVRPRSKKQAIILNEENECYVHVKSAPLRGQANLELLKLFAKVLKVPTERIHIISGEKSQNKTLLIEAVKPNIVRAALKK